MYSSVRPAAIDPMFSDFSISSRFKRTSGRFCTEHVLAKMPSKGAISQASRNPKEHPLAYGSNILS